MTSNHVIVPVNGVEWPSASASAAVATSVTPLATDRRHSFDWRMLTVGEVRRHLQPEDTFVTIWNGVDRPATARLDQLLETEKVAITAVLTLESDPLPGDLLSQLATGLGILARLPTKRDLVCFARESLVSVSEDTPLLQLLVECASVQYESVRCAVRNSAETQAEHGSAELTCNLQTLSDCDEPFPSERLPSPGPGHPVLSSRLLNDCVSEAIKTHRLSAMQQKCLQAGVLLLWDQLDESHIVSQSMEGQGMPRTADYWHGIMHRREPDAGNASYWFRRVGAHPAFASLASNLSRWMQSQNAPMDEVVMAGKLLNSRRGWDPFEFIRLSEIALRKPGESEDRVVRRVQYFEIMNLLAYTMGES